MTRVYHTIYQPTTGGRRLQLFEPNGLTIVETDGEREGAKVVLNSKELSFYDGGGARALFFDPGTGTYKFMGELNVADRFKADKNGNVVMKGSINLSDGNITWGGKGPVRYQFSTDGANWHDAMAANDKYRRDSLDGGTTWGDAYQFKGEDGKPGADGADGRDGTDATVPKYITDTIISKGVIEAPQIYVNDFAIYPNNPNDTTGTFKIFGMYRGAQYNFFSITYQDVGYPIVTISGDDKCRIEVDSDVHFNGNVSGVYAVFK